MADDSIRQDRLHWTGGYYREAVWPREPDIDVIRSLARRHLVAELPAHVEDALLQVSFFAEGGFNKLYQIAYAGHHTSFLLRVALPIVPYYKTESEVATISFLRSNTSISVPRIFAWDSNRDNELTFEWILMEKIAGEPLWDLWRSISWKRKLELTEEIAGMIQQLRVHKFEGIGGLFYKPAVKPEPKKLVKVPGSEMLLTNIDIEESIGAIIENAEGSELPFVLRSMSISGQSRADNEFLTSQSRLVNYEDRRQLKQSVPGDLSGGRDSQISRPTTDIATLENLDEDNVAKAMDQAEFSVDRIFDPLFFTESRLYLPGNRGPYKSSLEWTSAEIQVQLRWIENGATGDEEEYGSDFGEEAPKMEAACHQFLDFLPALFAEEDEKDSFILHHHDLNAANILVDPETFEITGIVDWEMINVVPEWAASGHPKFLQYIEPFNDEEPPVPSYENENHVDVEARDQWEYRALRRHWDETMKHLSEKDVAIDNAMKTKAKRDCHDFISELTGNHEWSLDWLKTYQTTGISRSTGEGGEETDGQIESESKD
ncbi:hypothetical protein P7C71_g238, partial [Lecanoromycetidae sp. Uapishka_2]